MTNPVPAPVSSDWQPWAGPTPDAWPTPHRTETPIRWRSEAVVAVLVATYSVVLGGVVGLVWAKYAPHLQIARAAEGSEAASKAVLGDDMWLALFGLLAGVVSVAVLMVVGREAGRGPGGVIGLAVGGVLGSLVAAQVGHLVQHPDLVAQIHHAFPTLDAPTVKRILGFFDFKLRWKAALVAWPFAAVVLHAATVIVRYLRLGPETSSKPSSLAPRDRST
jgi:hypothetical protein